MRDHLLRVMRNNVKEVLEYCTMASLRDSPNIKEVEELLTDALIELEIEVGKDG